MFSYPCQIIVIMEEIEEAVEEMKLIKTGKKKTRNAEDFLNGLWSKSDCCFWKASQKAPQKNMYP